MSKCKLCGVGGLRIISGMNNNFVIVHCQEPRCDVTYEEDVRFLPPEMRKQGLRKLNRATRNPKPSKTRNIELKKK